MAKIKFTSYIRRINRRLAGLAKQFGTASPIYQREAVNIDAIIPQSNIRYNQQGVIQIAKPKSLEEKGFSEYLMEERLSIPTPSEVYSDYKSQYASYLGETSSPLSINDFVNAMQNVNDLFNRFFDSSQVQEFLSKQENALDKETLKKANESLSNFMNQRETGQKPSYQDFINLSRVVDKYGI